MSKEERWVTEGAGLTREEAKANAEAQAIAHFSPGDVPACLSSAEMQLGVLVDDQGHVVPDPAGRWIVVLTYPMDSSD